MLQEDSSLTVQDNSMITFKQKGNFKNTERFFSRAQQMNVQSILAKYGSEGVSALSKATPVETGLTARSWDFTTGVSKWGYTIEWFNRHENSGVNVAIILQYGHGTGTGGYVQGRDYINPAMRSVFDKMTAEIWKEVSNL